MAVVEDKRWRQARICANGRVRGDEELRDVDARRNCQPMPSATTANPSICRVQILGGMVYRERENEVSRAPFGHPLWDVVGGE